MSNDIKINKYTSKKEHMISLVNQSNDGISFAKEEVLQDLHLNMLQPYANHPFKPYDGNRLDDMIQSIRDNGVMIPIIVRPLEGEKYEILSGHNRVNSARAIGLETIPAIVRKGLTDFEAELYVTETNLIQRSFTEMSHSERALAIATRHKAMKHQGKRAELIEEIDNMLNVGKDIGDMTSSPVEKKLTSIDKIGKVYALSKDTIARYLRINELIDVLKERLDSGNLSIRAAVTLSYLSDDEQHMVNDILTSTMYKVSMANADALREDSQKGVLNKLAIEEILSGSKKAKPTHVSDFKLKSKFITRYFADVHSPQHIEDTILKALDYYFSHNKIVENEGECNDRDTNTIESYN